MMAATRTVPGSRPAPRSSPDTAETRGRPSSALRLTGLTRRFGPVIALDGIDIDVPAGQFMVLLGPSGSGKTTLLRLVAGIDRPSAGTIAIGDRVVADPRRHLPPQRRGLAMVFQDYALWPQISVLHNVVYALDRLRLPHEDALRRGMAMLDRVGLAALANRRPTELSGGEQQRVALARALVARPAVLLCDEPLSNLDADLRERLRAEIGTLARENDTTVVYITHDQTEAFALADRIGVFQAGSLVQCDRPESVYHAPATRFVARFTGVAGELHGLVAGQRDAEGRVLVNTPNGRLTASANGPVARDCAVDVVVRPASARLVEPGDEGGGLPGRVRDVAYRGHGYEHVVELADGTRLAGVFDRQRRLRADEVRVRLDPEGCFAYPVDTST